MRNARARYRETTRKSGPVLKGEKVTSLRELEKEILDLREALYAYDQSFDAAVDCGWGPKCDHGIKLAELREKYGKPEYVNRLRSLDTFEGKTGSPTDE